MKLYCVMLHGSQENDQEGPGSRCRTGVGSVVKFL